jgi:hypothetical protein
MSKRPITPYDLVTLATLTSTPTLDNLLATIEEKVQNTTYDPETKTGRKLAKTSIAEVKNAEKQLLELAKKRLQELSSERALITTAKTRIRDFLCTTLDDFSQPLLLWEQTEKTRLSNVKLFFEEMPSLQRRRPKTKEEATALLDYVKSYDPLEADEFKTKLKAATALLDETIATLERRISTAPAAVDTATPVTKSKPKPALNPATEPTTETTTETTKPENTITDLSLYCSSLEHAKTLFKAIKTGKITGITYTG